ncbi:MAG: MFS transporter [Gammaproteobacteria bacterium]|nr:MFS transporter [Gammaproteobacteria bacterium]
MSAGHMTSLWRRRHAPWVMLWPLAVAQLVSWGTLYYSFPLFVGPMLAELQWPVTAANGALTVGLLVTGLAAYPVATVLDRHGGRMLMTCGSIGAGLLLLVWSRIESLPAFFALWLALGACMACVLMESLFALVNQHFGDDARRGMTAVTLVTGFSGTVFVPLIGALEPAVGWRDALLVLAAFNLVVCAPIHWVFAPPWAPAHPQVSAHDDVRTDAQAVMRARLRNPVFWGLVLWYTSYSLTASSILFQFVPLLRVEGVPNREIYFAFALIGPVQVGARIFLVTLGRSASLARLGAVTTVLVPLALVVLIVAPSGLAGACLFSALFAIGHGITTILRGVAPAEWLGRRYYARTMGALALPMMIAMAVAPLWTASVWAASRSPTVVWSCVLAGSLIGTAGFWIAVCARRRQRVGGA